MTDGRHEATKDELHPIPSWAYDPRRHSADWETPSFGVVVQPLVEGHESDIAPLSHRLNICIRRALDSSANRDGFCAVAEVPPGHRDSGCRFEVRKDGAILRDLSTGNEYPLHRYIPPWARDPRTVQNNEGDTIYCVEVHPLEPGHEFDFAPLGRGVSEMIDKILNGDSPYLQFCDLGEIKEGTGAGCHLAVQRGRGILLDKDTGKRYKLHFYTPKFYVYPIPDWAMKMNDYLKTEAGKRVDCFVGIKVKVKGTDGKEQEDVVIPKAARGHDLMAILTKKACDDIWSDFKCEGDVDLQVNSFRSLIRETDGERRVYKIVFKIAPVALSDPYESHPGDMWSTNEFSFSLPDGKTEKVEVKIDGDIKSFVHHCYSRVLSENGAEKTEKEPDASLQESSHDQMEMGRCKMSHGQFIWVYEDPPQSKNPGATLYSFSAKPYGDDSTGKSISEGLEKALKRGETRYSFKINHDGCEEIEYEVDISSPMMIQRQKNSPFNARRVWRIGTSFKKNLRDCWRLSRKFLDVSGDVPAFWDEHGDDYYQVDLESDEGKHVLRIIQGGIDEYEANPHPMTGFGKNWGDPGEVEMNGAGNPVHFIDVTGKTRTEIPKAIHVAAILRLQKQVPYTSFRLHQNNILFRRGHELSHERESRYLADNPMATGPINDPRVNEMWGFHSLSPEIAAQIITNQVTMNVRATSENNTFGRGFYLTDSFVKAMKYCGCPICKGGQRGAHGVRAECICVNRNLTHPRIMFLSPTTLGHCLIIRDVPHYLMHRSTRGNNGSPLFGFNTNKPATVWCDSTVRGEEGSAIDAKLPNSVVRPFGTEWSSGNKPWFFFVKNACVTSSGYKRLLDALATPESDIIESIHKLPFGIIVDDGASDDAVALARVLRDALNGLGASECLYIPAGMSLDDILARHVRDENLDGVVAELSEEPGRGMKVVIPDMENTKPGVADSLFIEDVLHCQPSMLRRHQVALPSMFRARQGKRREMVAFGNDSVCPQYAILFYEYESEEAMRQNIPLEFPQNRHGLEDADPMHFILRDVDVGDPDHPETPSVPIPPPDPIPLPGPVPGHPVLPPGSFTSEQF